jgi:hypothetical protein
MSLTPTRREAEKLLIARLMESMSEQERWRLLEPGFHFDDESEYPEKYATPELKYAAFVEEDSVFHEAWTGPIYFQLMEEVCAMSNAGLIRNMAEQSIEVAAIIGDPPPRCACYCCGFLTLQGRGQMRRCPVCAWIDEHPIRAEFHPENDVPLAEAQENFRRHGVSDLRRAASVRTDGIYAYEHLPEQRDPPEC